jgi:tRNA-splicing ligase RtcB
VETHEVDGKERKLCVHRKGATRAFPPHSPFIPEDYKKAGQPVLIPGDMGRYSYVLVGTETALKETFGSTCHGAGRMMSRRQAQKVAKGRSIIRELEDQGIYVRGAGKGTINEEISEAYKDVTDVVNVVHQAGIGKKVARLKPMGVIKG